MNAKALVRASRSASADALSPLPASSAGAASAVWGCMVTAVGPTPPSRSNGPLSPLVPRKPRVSLWISSNCCLPTCCVSSTRRRDSCCCISHCAEICACNSGLWYVKRSLSLGKSGREIRCTACVNIVSAGCASKLCVLGKRPIQVSHSCGGLRRYLLIWGSGSTTCHRTTAPCGILLRTRSFRTTLSGQFIRSMPLSFTRPEHSNKARPSASANSL
mmetsp:Transcript_126195/g.351609  ORF Transcript_126195/g.351609 Transcript_126195/m.351609 type:complete len:217 (+) Transcript_126195:540-1190(+)